MKTMIFPLILAVALASCADMATTNTKNLLASAGFQTRKPETAEQTRIYESMEPHKLYGKEVRGRMIYAYKDPEQDLVYIGGPKEYTRYQQYAEDQRMVQEYRMEADLRTDVTGRYSYWWY